ncbi:MAG TPA: hypothetical protein VFA21_03700 [Pyrinomonadaceae bacterium]|nr:hypothetical protein [Pyrinomonadaceae bacterium]
MRKILISSVVAFVLAAQALAGVAAAPANFAGTWALDKSKSKDLPPQMSNLDSLTLTVTQDAQQITVDSKAAMAASASEGSAGGGEGGVGRGRGRGMGGGFAPSATYKLDGTETTAEGPRGGTSTLKAEWKDGGKTLVLHRVSKLSFQGNDVTLTTTEEWSLSSDGKTLTVKRTSESPRGTQSSTLVFNKQ